MNLEQKKRPRQTLKDVKEKWRTMVGGSSISNDNPLFCEHNHCKYWRGKKSPLSKSDEEEESDDE